MARQLTADRLAARLAKLDGGCLSAEEYGAGDDLLGDDDSGNGQPAPIHDAKGRVDITRLLWDLLKALGVELPPNTNEAEFKQELYSAAMGRRLSQRANRQGEAAGWDEQCRCQRQPADSRGSRRRDAKPAYFAFSLSTIEGTRGPKPPGRSP